MKTISITSKLIITLCILSVLFSLTACSAYIRISDDKLGEYTSNKLIFEEINTAYNINDYSDIMSCIFNRNRYSNSEDFYNKLTNINSVSENFAYYMRDMYENELRLLNYLDEQDKQTWTNDNNHDNTKEEALYKLYDMEDNLIGETKDFDEYAKYQYDTFGIVVAPPDDYEPSEEYKEIQDSIKDKSEDGESNSLNLASYSVYKDKIVLKYISIMNNIQVYVLHLDEDGKVVGIDGI